MMHVTAGLKIYSGPGSLFHDFKIWPITFQGSGPSGPILFRCEKMSLYKKYSSYMYVESTNSTKKKVHVAGLPLGGRTPYITSKNRLRPLKLHIKDVQRKFLNTAKTEYREVLSADKTRPHLLDYLNYVPPSYWKLIYFVY